MESKVFLDLRALIANHTNCCREDEITRSSEFTSLGIDSLDMVELGIEIEDEYDISLDDGHLSKMRTVGELVEYVEKMAYEVRY